MYQALGISYPITLPVVGKQNIDVPVDRMSQDAINAAWPVLKARLDKELPGIIAKSAPAAMTQLRSQLMVAVAIHLAAIGLAALWIKKG
jgi:hypothetical protein